jgi:multicomponent Na+:H+ antiporter subunit D
MTMINQLPFLVVGGPLFTALFIAMAWPFFPSLIRPIGWIGMFISTGTSIALFNHVSKTNSLTYNFGNWPAPIGIEYSIDHLNALMILMIYVVAFFAFMYSIRSVTIEISPKKHGIYYTLYFLLITGLVGITITGDAFNLYVLFEICALSSYALLAAGGKRAVLATFYYLLIGTIGACFYLIGVAYLFIKTGTLNMSHLFELIPPVYFTTSILIAFIFINVGLFIKMALFPLHGWMPNVYTKAPISTACLLAPLGTKLAISILIRFYFDVFGIEYVYHVLGIQSAMVWLSTIAILIGAIYAIFHTSFRHVISFIVVAEIGYIIGGLWIGHPDSILGAVYHIGADALMTLALFMIAGNLIFHFKSDKLLTSKNLFKQLPLTSTGLIIVFASVVGIPPTPGFFTKLFLIKGAYQMEYTPFIVALIASSLTGIFIFFRIFELSFFEKKDPSDGTVIKESRWLSIPLLLVCSTILLFGITFNFWHDYILNIIPGGIR